MNEIVEIQESPKDRNRRVHMANERTFLAWIRTCIGIMAFGFVVEKFAMFMKQISVLLGKSTIDNTISTSHEYSAIIGIFIVGMGTLLVLFAFVRYKKVGRQIESDTYQPSSILDLLLALFVLTVGVFLVIYLIYTMK